MNFVIDNEFYDNITSENFKLLINEKIYNIIKILEFN